MSQEAPEVGALLDILSQLHYNCYQPLITLILVMEIVRQPTNPLADAAIGMIMP